MLNIGMNQYKVGAKVRVLRKRNKKGIYYDAVVIHRFKGKDGKYVYDVMYKNEVKENGVVAKYMKRDHEFKEVGMKSSTNLVGLHGALVTMNTMF